MVGARLEEVGGGKEVGDETAQVDGVPDKLRESLAEKRGHLDGDQEIHRHDAPRDGQWFPRRSERDEDPREGEVTLGIGHQGGDVERQHRHGQRPLVRWRSTASSDAA